jgi:hypothetical protein
MVHGPIAVGTGVGNDDVVVNEVTNKWQHGAAVLLKKPQAVKFQSNFGLAGCLQNVFWRGGKYHIIKGRALLRSSLVI